MSHIEGLYIQVTLPRHRVPCVEQQVQDHLLDLPRIALENLQIRI